MKIIIENGTTLIKTGDAFGGVKNKWDKTGVSMYIASDGSTKYKAEVQVKRKKHYLGIRNTPEEAAALRAEADKHIEAGTFTEWLKTIKRISYHNRFKVKGISEIKRPNGNLYQAEIRHEGTRYYLGKRKTPEEAIQLIEDANAHIETGTFTEWLAELKRK